jgi:hypothetical protein
MIDDARNHEREDTKRSAEYGRNITRKSEDSVENGRGQLLITDRNLCGISTSHEKPLIVCAAKCCLGQNDYVHSVEGTRQ